MSKPIVNVAIGLLFHKTKVLVGWRESHQHQGNKNEFPGGKVEIGETPEQACTREILEEVGVEIETWHRFDLIQHEYDDVHVHLHIFHAVVPPKYLDQLKAPWTWYERSQLRTLNFPKANLPMIERLVWPKLIKISSDLPVMEDIDEDRLVYFRPQIEPTQFLIDHIESLPISALKTLIVNLHLWKRLKAETQKYVAAVHYKHDQLMALKEKDVIRGIKTIAACHDLASLLHAEKLGLGAVTLSPIQSTFSHPDQMGIGWQQFEEWTQEMNIPVFALGGLKPDDIAIANRYGAYGVAGIRAF